MPKRSRHPPPEHANPEGAASSSVVLGLNEGIVSSGPGARNVLHRTEGNVAFRITRFPQQNKNLSREPWHEQPSQLLLAQHQVVPFTGRDSELEELRQWLDYPDGPENALRLLHAPGGQGKTRLALKLAAGASRDWRVWQATTRPARTPTATSGAAPRAIGKHALVIVDYAERWSAEALVALVAYMSARPAERRRVLLIARSAGSWWRELLHDLRNDFLVDTIPLHPLTGEHTSERLEAYLAARNSFARALELPNPEAVKIPTGLDLDDDRFGLMLTVHMAALVAVYAHVAKLSRPNGENAAPEPSGDPETLSAFLLDRERAHWAKLRAVLGEDGIAADTMAQSVYTATLTGRLSYADGRSALEQIGVESNRPPGSILKAHARAYPADADGMYMEPLYPDRLGEDFLALSTPGHQRPYPCDPWTDGAIERLLAAPEDSSGPGWTRHALIILIETAARWPHIASSQLYPFLRHQPQRMLEAGGAALAALANLENVDFAVLEAIEACFPGRHFSLDAGMAALSQRLGTHLLKQTNDPAKQAQIHNRISSRCHNASQHRQGIGHAKEAVRLYRKLATENPSGYKEALAGALNSFGIHLELTGQQMEALAATQEAADIVRELISHGRADLEPMLGRFLANLAARHQLDSQSRLTIAREAVAIGRRCYAENPNAKGLELAGALENLASALEETSHQDEAIAAAQEAVAMRREQATRSPEVYTPDLIRSLNNLSWRLNDANESAQALRTIEEVIELCRRRAAADPASHEADLARSLRYLGSIASGAGQGERAIAANIEAIELYRRLAAANPASYEASLARSLHNLGEAAAEAGQSEQAIASYTEAIELYRRLAATDPAYESELAASLFHLAVLVAAAGQDEQAIASYTEAIELYRRLAATDPAYESELAASLNNIGVSYAQLKDHGERAIASYTEAIELYRRLAATNPASYEASLARSLHNLGEAAAEAGQGEQAIASYTEAIELYRRLAATDPAYKPSLASTLFNIGKAANVEGRRTVAIETATEAAEIFSDAETRGSFEEELAVVANFLKSIYE